MVFLDHKKPASSRPWIPVGRHHLDGSHNQVIFSKPVYFPTTSSFQIKLIIIPELVSSDNSNQKQLEALVVNHEPQSAGEMTNGWSIWQFTIAGHMDSKSMIIIRLNLGRSKDGYGSVCQSKDHPTISTVSVTMRLGTGILKKGLFWVLDMFDNKKNEIGLHWTNMKLNGMVFWYSEIAFTWMTTLFCTCDFSSTHYFRNPAYFWNSHRIEFRYSKHLQARFF